MSTHHNCTVPYQRLKNKSSYDSAEGNMLFDYFNENPVLKKLIFNTTFMTNSVNECIQFCLKQSQLESLIFYTDELDVFSYTDECKPPLLKLKFLCVTSKFYVDNIQDYIFPFLKNAPNLEHIFYANGSLSNESIQILCKMPAKNLHFIQLDTVHIHDQKFFQQASKEFDKIFWLLRQRYISGDLREPNFLISAWRKFFRN